MKIICVGRNYSEHATELNNPVPTSPVIFMKPDTALLKDNKPFYLPSFSQNLQYELELVLKIGKEGKKIAEKFAAAYISEIGIGIDFTARDLQNELKEKGLPWELAKGFDNSAPISNFFPVSEFKNLSNISFSLQKNGNKVQIGNTSNCIFSFDYLISYISGFITLKKGDLIFTGTPAGVGKVKIGDKLEGYLENKLQLSVEVK